MNSINITVCKYWNKQEMHDLCVFTHFSKHEALVTNLYPSAWEPKPWVMRWPTGPRHESCASFHSTTAHSMFVTVLVKRLTSSGSWLLVDFYIDTLNVKSTCFALYSALTVPNVISFKAEPPNQNCKPSTTPCYCQLQKYLTQVSRKRIPELV